MRVASENIPKQGVGVVSVSLANNGLRDVRGVESLANTFPDLKVETWSQNMANVEPESTG